MLKIKELRNKKNESQTALAEAIGVSLRTIQNYESGKVSAPHKKLEQIAQHYNVTVAYLFSNESNNEIKGDFIENKNGNRFEELPNGKYKIYVKKLPVNAFGSYLSDFQNVDFINELEEVSFTVDHIGRGKYMCFEVDGDSMNGGGIYDTPDGAELLVRELGRQHWKDGFRESKYGWVIVHKETVLFKDLKDLDFETGEITCFSRSGLPQHGSFKINLNDVNQIFKVIKRTF